MEINLQRITNPADLDKIRDLYISSFPEKERREFYKLPEMLVLLECSVCLISISGGKIAGLCIFWDFGSFTFLEHFAIEDDLRGLGIGEEVLSVLREKYKIILLETELPEDEISQRRVKFYQRNGFRMLQRRYIQPSYGKNKPEVELQLMSTSVDFSVQTLDEYIHLIRERVYRKIF
jgi:ribosomal protein S18 acetylase RimI-like enzyme